MPGRAGGAAAILAVAALWGSTAAHFAPAGAGPVSVGAARIVVGGALLLAIALCSQSPAGAGRIRQLLAVPGTARTGLVLGAASTAGYQLSFFSAVRATGVAVGTVVAIGSAPVFTGLISRLTGGPALTGRWMLATAGGGRVLRGAARASTPPGRTPLTPA
jgi:drug/metabolite transporter, DME family